MNKTRKLNILQRGALQTWASIIVYSVCGIAAALIFDRLEKARFIVIAEQAQKKGTINQETAQHLKMIINTPDFLEFLCIIISVFIGIAVILWLMRLAAGLNWSWPVTLPKAVEFSTAMQKMGKFDIADQMASIHKHRLRVYIAETPIHGEQHENIRAKLYPYANNKRLVLESVITTNIGKRLLCLDADDYEPIYQKYSLTEKVANSARVAELEEAVKVLNGFLKSKEEDNDKLTGENANLSSTITRLKNKEKTDPARETKAQKGEQKKIPFWRVAGPLINRLIAEAGPDTKYTRPQIQAEFEKELEGCSALKPVVAVLLRTSKKEAEGVPFDLEGWAMELIRVGLGEYAKKEGGAAKKS